MVYILNLNVYWGESENTGLPAARGKTKSDYPRPALKGVKRGQGEVYDHVSAITAGIGRSYPQV